MKQNHPIEPVAWRAKDAARALGISPKTLWSLTAPRGSIPCIYIGGTKRRTAIYPRSALEAWLAQQTSAANQEGQ